MVCVWSWLGGLSLIIVSIQIYRKVLPWIYQNIVGPLVFGSNINLNKYGDWACKCHSFFETIFMHYYQFFTSFFLLLLFMHENKIVITFCVISKNKKKIEKYFYRLENQ